MRHVVRVEGPGRFDEGLISRKESGHTIDFTIPTVQEWELCFAGVPVCNIRRPCGGSIDFLQGETGLLPAGFPRLSVWVEADAVAVWCASMIH